MYWDKYWDDYPRVRPLPKALPGREKKIYGEKWWSQRWLVILDGFGWSNRLQRGKAYARAGMVKSLNILKGSINAKVKGSQPSPYLVNIDFKVLSKKEWNNIIVKMSSQALFSSKLLAGEMPQNIEGAFKLTKVSLFASKNDIKMKCSCPDFAVPCKHIAAVFYVIADNFDNDPFVLFKIRGMDKKELLKNLKNKRMGGLPSQEDGAEGIGIGNIKIGCMENEIGPDVSDVLLESESCIKNFWDIRDELGNDLKTMNFSISKPEVSCVVLKRLGKPAFWESNMDFNKEMELVYDRISSKAIEMAFNKGKNISK